MGYLRATVSLSLVVSLGSACSVLFPDSSPPTTGTTPGTTGCPATPNQPIASGGYYVNGNTICTASGQPHLFHGVDRPSLEWSNSGVLLSAADFQLMASWQANAVRIALNQDFWLSGSPYFDDGYPARVDQAIKWAEAAGLDVILDLHWSDRGTLGSCDPKKNCQQSMADSNSKTFWADVAARYANDGRVLFELYNEPHDVSWGVWRAGGSSGQNWTVVGMQQLYDTVRAAGAHNLVVIGGLNWAYDLSGVKDNRISGYNIVYATHPYNTAGRQPQSWDHDWGYLTATDPVIVTEFGDQSSCSSDYAGKVIAYADQHKASWTAWAWFDGGCTFPSLITDWDGTPSMVGAVVKAALAGYHGSGHPPITDGAAPPADGAARDGGDSGATDGPPSAEDAAPSP